MPEIIYGSLLFGVAFTLHIIAWRIYIPRRQTKILLLIFLGVLLLGSLILFRFAAAISTFGMHPPTAMVGCFRMWLFVVTLILAYMITYSAIEADSPSLLIILKIHAAGSSGLDKELVALQLDDGVLIKPRLNDLLVDKMAELHHEKYRLKAKGAFMARLFTFHRNLIRANKGG